MRDLMASDNFEEIFTQVLNETQSNIRAFIVGMGVAFDRADDIAQDVFVHYYKEFDRKPEEVEHIAWLKGIARNYCLRYFDQQNREKVYKEKMATVLKIIENSTCDLDELESESLLNKLYSCMKKVSDKNMHILKSRYEKGLSYEEIGIELKTSSTAVGMILTRIRKSLQKCMGK